MLVSDKQLQESWPVLVVNVARADEYDVYIGRGRGGEAHMNNTPVGQRGWLGNPYKMGEDGSRLEVIEQFEEDFWDRLEEDEEFRGAVMELAGETLACWCAPKACHGSVIAQAVARLNPEGAIKAEEVDDSE